MERDRQFVSPNHTQHLDPNQALRKEDGVPSVDRDGIDRLEPMQRPAIQREEGAGAAHVYDRAAGLDTTKYIALGEVLVFDGDSGRAVNPSLLECL
jgi:hypothetical protein